MRNIVNKISNELGYQKEISKLETIQVRAHRQKKKKRNKINRASVILRKHKLIQYSYNQ